MKGKTNELVAILHNIRSVHNVGSMFRTADGAGVAKIYLTGYTPTPVDRWGSPRKDFAKVSLGAEHSVAWEAVKSPAALMRKLKKEGYALVALEQAPRSVSYARFVPKKKIALLVGNEVRGVSPALLARCDEVIEIPMRGAMVRHVRHPRHIRRGKESLNASVAFGIAVYALRLR